MYTLSSVTGSGHCHSLFDIYMTTWHVLTVDMSCERDMMNGHVKYMPNIRKMCSSWLHNTWPLMYFPHMTQSVLSVTCWVRMYLTCSRVPLVFYMATFCNTSESVAYYFQRGRFTCMSIILMNRKAVVTQRAPDAINLKCNGMELIIMINKKMKTIDKKH